MANLFDGQINAGGISVISIWVGIGGGMIYIDSLLKIDRYRWFCPTSSSPSQFASLLNRFSELRKENGREQETKEFFQILLCMYLCVF